MNWLRIILDGIVMSAVFNLATGLIITVDPVIFTTSFPKPIRQSAPVNPHALRHKILFCLTVILPIFVFGVLSAYEAGIRGFFDLFAAAYIEYFIVNLGDFFGLDLALREYMKERWELPGTHGHPCYQRKNWLSSLAIMEHFVLWPLLVCPLFAVLSACLGLLLV